MSFATLRRVLIELCARMDLSIPGLDTYHYEKSAEDINYIDKVLAIFSGLRVA
jgi:hypothetical protein